MTAPGDNTRPRRSRARFRRPCPTWPPGRFGGGVVSRQRRALRRAGEPDQARPPAVLGVHLRPQGPGLRRLGDPAAAGARARLGDGPARLPGVIRGVVIDTAFFTGNYPPEVSVEGAAVEGYPSPAELRPPTGRAGAESAIKGDAVNDSRWPRRSAHARPAAPSTRTAAWPGCGCTARRARPAAAAPTPSTSPPWRTGPRSRLQQHVLLLAGQPASRPGSARVMGEGWETARRRDDGNDWVEVALAGPGVVRLVELDTS